MPRVGLESNEHKELKAIGVKFLREFGCRKITEEYLVNGGEKWNKNCFLLDVLGILGNKKIAVECGGSNFKKLIKLNNWADQVYILPYGETKPFLWQPDIKICRTCGHKINGVKSL